MRARTPLTILVVSLAAVTTDCKRLDGLALGFREEAALEPASLAPFERGAGVPEVEAAEEEGEEAPADEGEASEPEAAPPETPAAGPELVVGIGREAWIYTEPRWGARKLGYLRAGAVLEREGPAIKSEYCPRGWYKIKPQGYVCVGKRASTDLQHPVAQLSNKRPHLDDAPYQYVLSRFPTPLMYARLPSVEQQQRFEPDRHHKINKYEQLRKLRDFVQPPEPDPIPPLLAGGQVIPGLDSALRIKSLVHLGFANVHSGFALLGSYEHEGRQFGLTTEMQLVPLDGVRIAAPATMRGVQLSDEFQLPVAFVQEPRAHAYRLDPATGALGDDGPIPYRSVHPLSGEARNESGHRYYETAAGLWLRGDHLARISKPRRLPTWAKDGFKWIDVSILQQSLVAYEGDKPVFVTLVSTGADGLMDPKETRATKRGTFIIHTKHITTTMDSEEQGDEFDLRDVPFVQYFTDGYALHGAYWHDEFGKPRSHGCVNLAPRDAAWLFGWTDPQVPKGWHAALSRDKQGTWVYVHP
jgi:hypothetical protein